jgi:hypothetical protein
MAQMLIANRLGDGLVVFRAADGTWVESIAAGVLIRNDWEANTLLGKSLVDADNNLIIDPNLIDVTEHDDARTPDAIREAIRAAGPTVTVET